MSDDGVLVTTAPDPLHSALVQVGWDGSTTAVGPDDHWVQGAVGGGTQVLVMRRISSSRAAVEVHGPAGTHAVTSLAEAPSSAPQVTVIEAGERALRARPQLNQ